MAAYPTMYQDGCRLLVSYSIMERRAWLEVQDRAAGTQNAGGIKIAEVDLGTVKMTDANLVNTGRRPRPFIGLPLHFLLARLKEALLSRRIEVSMMLNEHCTKKGATGWVLLQMRSLKSQHVITQQPPSFTN